MYGTVSCPGCPDPVFCPVYGFWNLHIIRDFWMQFNPEHYRVICPEFFDNFHTFFDLNLVALVN